MDFVGMSNEQGYSDGTVLWGPARWNGSQWIRYGVSCNTASPRFRTGAGESSGAPTEFDEAALLRRVRELADELASLARKTEASIFDREHDQYRADQLGLAMGYRRSAIRLRAVLDD